MKKIIFAISLDLFLISSIYSQFTMQWADLYQGAYGKSLAVDGSGNVYVTGWGNGIGYNTIKYNSSGVQQWLARYRGIDNGNDYAFSIAVDHSGNVYVTGWSQGGGNATDIVTIKYSSSGDSTWVRRYRGPGVSSSVPGFEPYLHLITLDDTGNVYVTGTSYGGGSSTNYDFATIKYNSSGVQQWVQRYDNPSANALDYATSISVDASGNVFVSGFSDANSAMTIEDFCTIKYSSTGVQQWVARYNNGGHNRVNGMTTDIGGNIYVTGWGGPAILSGPGGYLTVKYNSSGVQQWFATYVGSSYDEASSVAVDAGSNVFVTGGLVTSSTASDYLTIKYNTAGVQQWTQIYNGTANGYDKANAITVDRVGSIYVTGTSNNGGSVFDYATVKYSNSGVQQWAARYNETGTANGSPVAISVDSAYNFYVTGSSGAKYVTLKYSQPVGIKPISSLVPDKFNLYQNYPNPFNPSTKIKFSVPLNKGGDRGLSVTLAIYDLLGREVAVLVNEQLVPGTYEVQWNASNNTSGVYFYRLMAGSFIETKKMLLIK